MSPQNEGIRKRLGIETEGDFALDTIDLPELGIKRTELSELVSFHQRFAALSDALTVADEIYGYYHFEGDTKTFITQVGDGAPMAFSIGHSGEELIQRRREDLQTALALVAPFVNLSRDVLSEVISSKPSSTQPPISADEIRNSVPSFLFSEPHEAVEELLLRCARIISDSEIGLFRQYIKVLQDAEAEIIRSENGLLAPFVSCLQNSWNAEAALFGIGAELIRDIEAAK